ncbi:MAG: ribosomal protein L7/L12 [Propionibacteriaceae bacterium]|jgi:large subunit ribosomal protein L7/L12|nr:ribosomal protein L7/L12 [Propionibacteriaceae bacterium]
MNQTHSKIARRVVASFTVLLMTFSLAGCVGEPKPAKSVTISTDGATIYSVSAPDSVNRAVYLEVFDRAKDRKTISKKVPASFFTLGWVVNQGAEVYLIVVRDDTDIGALVDIYQCKSDKAPEKVSDGNFYFNSSLSSPVAILHNTIVLIGHDRNNQTAVMYIQDGQISVFILDTMAEFAAGISSIGFIHHNASYTDAISVTLYDNQKIYLSGFHTDAGTPMIIPDVSEEVAVFQFAQAYYGEHNLLYLRKQDDSSSVLVTAPVPDPAGKTPPATEIESVTLYRAITVMADRSTQLVLGYTAPNPNLAQVTGYLYDIPSGSLTKLPTFENFDISKVHSVIAVGDNQLILRLGSIGGQEGALVLSRDDGSLFYASSVNFGRAGVFSQAVSIVAIIIGPWLVIGAIALVVRRKLKHRATRPAPEPILSEMRAAAVPVATPTPTKRPAPGVTYQQDQVFGVYLESAGRSKVSVAKVLIALTGLGLREAVDLVNSAPCPILEQLDEDTAEKAITALRSAGATVSHLR